MRKLTYEEKARELVAKLMRWEDEGRKATFDNLTHEEHVLFDRMVEAGVLKPIGRKM